MGCSVSCSGARFLRAPQAWSWPRNSGASSLALSPGAQVEVGTIVVPDEWLTTEVSPSRRDGTPKLLYISRIEPRKGLRETLDALYLLKQRGCEPELLVAGEGPALGDLRRYASVLGLRNVTYCGLVLGDQKRELFDRASILALPSSYGEGLPVVVGEAMARGLAVITTPVGGLADIFVDGKMGALVPPGDPRAVADAIEALVTRPEELRRISEYNRQAAGRLFSSAAFAGQLLAWAHEPAVEENRKAPRRDAASVERVDTPPRVLVTTPSLSMPGGVAQYMRALRPHLEGEVHYFTVGCRSDNERILSAGWRLASDYWRFVQTLWRGPYDVVHLNPSLGSKALVRDGLFLLISKVFQKSVVVLLHGWDEDCERMLKRGFVHIFRPTYDRADAFIVLASRFREHLRDLGYDRTVFVETAPVDDAILDDQGRRPVRHGRRRFKILFLSRIEIAKGIYEALDAYRLVKRDFPFASLDVAGGGSELRGATAYAADLKLADVSFTGHLTGARKRDAFKNADAFLFPSHSEGLPIAVLEAMAYGLPIVTRAVGGLGDFFENGRMGFMTQSYEPEVFAVLMGRLISDPALCARVSAFNRTYAREHFTATQVVARLEHIYRSVLAGAH